MKNPIWFVVIPTVVLCILIIPEIWWAREANRTTKYTIELYHLSGRIDTIIVNRPADIHYQINCHSHKQVFQGCNLEYVNKGLLGGHWASEVDGVDGFKIIKIENNEHTNSKNNR